MARNKTSKAQKMEENQEALDQEEGNAVATEEVNDTVDNEDEKPATRRSQMRDMYKEGFTRSQIADEFGVKYQAVYAATKDMGSTGAARSGGGGRKIFLEEGPGAGMARVDYIRQEFAKGRTRGEIARELDIAYQIVFQATKGQTDVPEGAKPKAKVQDDEEGPDFEDTEELPD